MDELRPCPFCGGSAEYVCKAALVNGFHGEVFRVRCSQCHAQSPYKRNPRLHGFHTTVESAADAWNRRWYDAI